MKALTSTLLLLLAISTLAQQLPPGTRSVANEDEERVELYKKAQTALEAQKYSEAETALREINRRDPKDAAALYQLGFVQEAQDKDDAAQGNYIAALAINPSQFESMLSLGFLEARRNHFQQAHTYLLKAVALQPGDKTQADAMKARAYRALAQLDVKTNSAAARDELLAALKLSPVTSEDTLLSAELADSAGDTEEAQKQYKNLSDSGQMTAEATVSYARFLLRHDMTDKATPLLEQLLAANPSDDALKRLLANIYSQSNQPAKAEPLIRSALEKSPDDPILMDDLGSALTFLKRSAEAQEVLIKAVSIPVEKWPTPKDLGEAATHLAFAASENRQPRIVLQALSLRSKLLPNSPSSLFLEATANDSLHQTIPAIDLYRKFLVAAAGRYPDQELQAKIRLGALEKK